MIATLCRALLALRDLELFFAVQARAIAVTSHVGLTRFGCGLVVEEVASVIEVIVIVGVDLRELGLTLEVYATHLVLMLV